MISLEIFCTTKHTKTTVMWFNSGECFAIFLNVFATSSCITLLSHVVKLIIVSGNCFTIQKLGNIRVVAKIRL